MTDIPDTAADELRRVHFPESATTYAFCHKCGTPFPCLPIRALDEVQDALDEARRQASFEEVHDGEV